MNTEKSTESKYQEVVVTPKEILAHELMHSYDADKGNRKHQQLDPETGVSISEERAVQTQSIVREKQQPDKPLRDNHGGKKLETQKGMHIQ